MPQLFSVRRPRIHGINAKIVEVSHVAGGEHAVFLSSQKWIDHAQLSIDHLSVLQILGV